MCIRDRVKTVQRKGGPYGNKRELINYVLQDYLEMNEIENMRNPYLIRIIREIVSSTVGESEKRLGGRLFKMSGEVALNVSIDVYKRQVMTCLPGSAHPVPDLSAIQRR